MLGDVEVEVEVEVGEAISGKRSQRALRTWDKG